MLATLTSLYFSCQTVAVLISLVTLVTTGMELNSYNTFMILTLVNSLRMTVSFMIAQPARDLADFAEALSRVQNLLEYENGNVRKYLNNAFTQNGDSNCGEKGRFAGDYFQCFNKNDNKTIPVGKDPTVLLRNAVCSWTGSWNHLALKSMCLSVDKGDLIFITGPVGCGKSSLLYAILKEISLISGEISCQGKIAWVSQQPWVFSGTIRDNILFGEVFDPHRYHTTLHACDLYKDLQRFPDADMTRVGERGILLSGGQRARVELARAVYSNADIYLLDDPLSAVDTKVGRHLFQTCISGILHGKTRLMVTHNLQILRDARQIVVMENGSTLVAGTFTSLLQSGYDITSSDGFAATKEAVILQRESPLVQEKSANDTILESDISGLENVDEDRVAGSVSWTIYWHYIQAGTCAAVAGAMLVFFILVQGFFPMMFLFLNKPYSLVCIKRRRNSMTADGNQPNSLCIQSEKQIHMKDLSWRQK